MVWDVGVFVDARMMQIEINEMATNGKKRGQKRAEYGNEHITARARSQAPVNGALWLSQV